MNKLSTAKRVAVVAALVEGNSIRSTARMTDVSKPTILKLLADLGEACATYHHEHVRNIRARRVQASRKSSPSWIELARLRQHEKP